MNAVPAESEMRHELRSPDELARATSGERMAAFSEDWVTTARRADSGERLGPETQAQVISLLSRGVDEAAIREAALAALADEEARIIRRHRLMGWAVFGFCAGIGTIAAINTGPRSDTSGLIQVALLSAIGLMIAHGVHMHGIRRRSRLVRSSRARKEIWRSAIAALAGKPAAPAAV